MSSCALLIVEGSGIEEKFFSPIQEKFAIDMEFVPYCGNVSMLYDDMVKTGFYANIVELLKSRETEPSKLAILNGRYTDIFVVLDFDPQHSIEQLPGESVDAALRRNVQRISRKALEMAKRMNNSTDPCSGKLYINFPSMESFRDMDSFCDMEYSERFISLSDLVKTFGGKGYKAIVGKRNMEKNPAHYSFENYMSIMAANVLKLSRVVDGMWRKMSYAEYLDKSNQVTVLLRQCKFINQALNLGVINTSSFIVVDYKGRSLYEALPFAELCAASSSVAFAAN